MKPTVFLFGEAEKGDFCKPYLCRSLPQLAETFGHPPMDTLGLFFAIQTLLFQKEIIFAYFIVIVATIYLSFKIEF